MTTKTSSTRVTAHVDQGRRAASASVLKLVTSPEVGLCALILALVAVFSLLSPSFFSIGTAQTIFRAVASVGIISVGMSLLLITGKFDLSVGSVAALGAVTAGQLMTAGVPVALSVLGGLVASAAVGMLNAWLTLWVNIPVLIVTLATLYIARGVALVITNGQAITTLPLALTDFGKAEIAGLPWPVWIFLFLVVIGHIVLRYTLFGRAAFASGGNAVAARIAGIRVRRVQTISFVVVSVLSGLAGILIMARIEVGQPSIGDGYELSVLAACVVGGVSLFGGRGSIIGAFLGVIFVQVVAVGMVLTKVDPTLQQVGIGAALLVAITVDVVRSRRAS